MDRGTVFGLAIAVIAILSSAIIEGGNAGPAALLRLLNLPGALIVFGGTIGALMTCSKFEDILKLGKYISLAMKNENTEVIGMIREIVQLADLARKEGLLSLENKLGNLENKFLRKGFEMVVDGTDPQLIKQILEIEIENMEERHGKVIQLFHQAGGFAPTMGMIGTVMGLVNVLANLSDTSRLGPAISTAFIATFYGVFTANIFWLPLGNKLKLKSKEEAAARYIVCEGILSVQAGEHPRIIAEKLLSFLPESERDKHGDIFKKSAKEEI